MSLREGREFECFRHNFKTDDNAEWEKHCYQEKHTISGWTPCAICKTTTQFDGLPFCGINGVPVVLCKNCDKEKKK